MQQCRRVRQRDDVGVRPRVSETAGGRNGEAARVGQEHVSVRGRDGECAGMQHGDWAGAHAQIGEMATVRDGTGTRTREGKMRASNGDMARIRGREAKEMTQVQRSETSRRRGCEMARVRGRVTGRRREEGGRRHWCEA